MSGVNCHPDNGRHPDDWYPRAKAMYPSTAARLCDGCPALLPCLEVALDYEAGKPVDDRHGVWGGTTPTERAQIEALRHASKVTA